MSDAGGPDRIILVGGAPRSGTSVTHALLCTSAQGNRYHPEVSFLRPIFEAHAVGMEHWEAHSRHFFEVPDHLRRHVGRLAGQSLNYLWRVLKRPRVMCLKDPLLTPIFPSLPGLIEWPVRFVTVLRHPHAVIRSQQEVYERSCAPFVLENVTWLAHEYMRSYAHLEDPLLDGSLFHFRYEDLGNDWLTRQLGDFAGLNDLDPLRIWNGGAHQPGPDEEAHPFYSPKYHRPLDVSRRLSPLQEEFREVVNRVCAPLMERSGYLPDGGIRPW